MTDSSHLNRRELIGRGIICGLAAAPLIDPLALRAAPAAGPRPLVLRARPELLEAVPGLSKTAVFRLAAEGDQPLVFRRGDALKLEFHNDLPTPASLDWLGLSGFSSARPPVAPGGAETTDFVLDQPGTYFCRLIASEEATRGLPLIVNDEPALERDRDQVMQIEEWRIRSDGRAVPPGADFGDAARAFTINGVHMAEVPIRANERVKFRFINSSQHSVIAIKIENHEVWIVAIDSRPAEPFPAHNSQFILAPGARVDAVIDGLPAPSTPSQILLHDGNEPRAIGRLLYGPEPPVRESALPPPGPPATSPAAQIDLARAARFDLPLSRDGDAAPRWRPVTAAPDVSAPALRVKRNRTVLLTLKNPATTAVTFRLQGHHFRLLDRLDDGWKPYWLDTLIVRPGGTERIAFAATAAGTFRLGAASTDWSQPPLSAWYVVE